MTSTASATTAEWARGGATLNPSVAVPQTQPDCLKHAATQLVDCGSWNVSVSAIPADAVSGIYVARLVRQDATGASHMVFIVRDDASTSDLLFQTSDTTWQAYNTYRGASPHTGAALASRSGRPYPRISR